MAHPSYHEREEELSNYDLQCTLVIRRYLTVYRSAEINCNSIIRSRNSYFFLQQHVQEPNKMKLRGQRQATDQVQRQGNDRARE